MGLFTKKADPIAGKAKSLNDQIAALELEIKKLERKSSEPEPPPVANPAPTPAPAYRASAVTSAPRVAQARPLPAREPIFESVDQGAPAGPDQKGKNEKDPHFNDLGVRKYDIAAAWRRLRNMIHGPSTHNPKLVSYLAAGSIRGLRPLRYEKRIARNRFIALTIFFVVILWSALGLFFRR